MERWSSGIVCPGSSACLPWLEMFIKLQVESCKQVELSSALR